ncbi:hypothetical protein SO802_025815 [Lithocarpus litseifolius]|uniref:RRM domain-containing protein n=1 Tax=Lithocarpus litseifolius TaxID=425828 RepID=A0AAW2BXR7_9ROSI
MESMNGRLSEDTLRKHFSNYGEVEEALILSDEDRGDGRGFGYVTFKDPAGPNNALSRKHFIHGAKVDVKPALWISSVTNLYKNNKKIFVGGLPYDLTELELKNYFMRFGKVRNAVDIKGKNHKYGFVTFDSEAAVHKVLKRSHVLKNTLLTVEMAGSSDNKKKIYVGGLPMHLTNKELKKYFESFGMVTNARVVYDEENKESRGFGFVTFDSEDVVHNVLQRSDLEIENRLLTVERADSDRNQRLIYTYDCNNTCLGSGCSDSVTYGHTAGNYASLHPYEYEAPNEIHASLHPYEYNAPDESAAWNYSSWEPYEYKEPNSGPSGVGFGALPGVGDWDGLEPSGCLLPYANPALHHNSTKNDNPPQM